MYFSRLQSATPKQLEALRGKGFDGYTAEVRAIICTEYAKTLNWLEEDRADADEIESQQIFIQRGYWPA